ncbi:MAG TPA: ribonuclease HII [Coriobacteriia bacterium]
MLAACPPEGLAGLIRRFSKDPRAGVRALAVAAAARLDRTRAEDARLDALMSRQVELHGLGFPVVAGIDEVGCGCLAGPVTACAVVLDPACRIEGLNDSKRLLPELRVRIADQVRTRCLAFSVAHVGPDVIDRVGIRQATRRAWELALEGLGMSVDHVLVDGNDKGALRIPTTSVVRGDSSEASIAAASVIAKVERNALMVALAADCPGYGFDINFGYGTPEHMAAIAELGPSPLHRLSFAPCATQDRLFP